MVELEAVPSVPLFENTFGSMSIPGETGVAVSRETSERRCCVAIGRSTLGYSKTLSEGEPFRIVKTESITPSEYESLVSLLEALPPRNGMVAAEVLDGESYLFRWLTSECEFRFVLCNPSEIESDYYKNIALKLAQLFANENARYQTTQSKADAEKKTGEAQCLS